MKAFVAVTDLGWYQHLLATGPRHDEVNFWFPSPRPGFKALAYGDPFLFKTHIDRRSPILSNRMVGGGRFSGFSVMTIDEVWDLLGQRNGVGSLAELSEKIGHYLKRPLGRFEDPEIGCVFLTDAVFFDVTQTLSAPTDFASNLVRGRGYNVDDVPENHSVVEAVLRCETERNSGPTILSDIMHGDPTLVIPRIGQQAFKAVIAENYHHRCAITGDKVRPVLEAAHIQAVSAGGQHRVDNGLLLRSDVHTLFDRGYLAVDLKHRLRVSPALRERFGNGDWFYAKEGTAIAVPDRRIDRPNREFLEWHNDEVFLSA
ncbi:HNH endonuclease [Gordonia sp. TBRC 11910]|uniref:HNH endonuclease n=1 Tax=Gordonia asplenii TaxID=2725283 RepID=A0A848KWK9_9ACTN|nr:HNH endonuclease [Gordonia asplenii]NMO03214.1 HNH endonuclease [Gordonia asplenii]